MRKAYLSALLDNPDLRMCASVSAHNSVITQSAFILSIAFMSKRKYDMPVWDFYQKDEANKLVTCKNCPKTYCLLKIANSHKALWYHLEKKHSSLLIPHENPPKKRKLSTPQATLHKFTAKTQKSQLQIYAEMVCKSRFTFNQIANDDFIKESMCDRGFNSHDSPNTIKCSLRYWLLS